jgi:hypothetical protein
MEALATITNGAVTGSTSGAGVVSAARSVGVTGTSVVGKLRGLLAGVLLMVLAVFSLPLAVLLIGTPLALFVRLILEIARRL